MGGAANALRRTEAPEDTPEGLGNRDNVRRGSGVALSALFNVPMDCF